VLDLTRVIAGPVATRYLGALGADVLRLDAPDRPELTLHAYDGLFGKRSALLDFGEAEGKRPAARAALRRRRPDARIPAARAGPVRAEPAGPGGAASRPGGGEPVGVGQPRAVGQPPGFDSIVQAASGIAMTESADGERPGALAVPAPGPRHRLPVRGRRAAGLARQSARGGTQFRELSLARTAHWLLGLPRIAATSGWPDGDDRAWLTTLDSAAGTVTTVRPPGQLDDEALAWPRSVSRYGGDEVAWAPGPVIRAASRSFCRAPGPLRHRVSRVTGGRTRENVVGLARLGP